MQKTEDSRTLFPKGERAPADYFTGTAWVNTLVPTGTAFNCVIANVVFEPGSRNNWHTHPGGQVLICTRGVGYYQQKGSSIRQLHEGDVVEILPEVKHWHGASADSEFTHIAINTNSDKGLVNWLEPVTDHEYKSYKNE
jgi:quercetin dioxygenase-like cupin family protein